VKIQLKYILKLPVFYIILASLSSCGEIDDTSEKSSNLTISSSVPSLNITGNSNVYAILTTTVFDEQNNPLKGARVQFETDLGSLEARSKTTDHQGIAKIKFYPNNTSGTATITAFINGMQQTVTIDVTASGDVSGDIASSNVKSISLTSANTEITADGTSVVKLTALVEGDENKLIADKTVSFTTNNGLLLFDLAGTTTGATLTAISDSNGEATLYLRASTQVTTAQINVFAEGVNASTRVKFIAGDVDITQSTITLTPATIPADGSSTAQIDVWLLDANNNIIADDTVVTLRTTDGSITTANPGKTTLGHAFFTLQSSINSGAVTLSILEYPGITALLTFGSPGTGEPFQIKATPESNSLFVNGVGKKDNVRIAIEVRGSTSNLIVDADPGVNNLEVSFVTSPQSGEALVGLDVNNQTVSSSEKISVRTVNGSASITLSSGTRPGVIGLRIESLNNSGQSLSPAVFSNLSEISIASGPPHNIAVSYPVLNSITNLGNALYRRVGSLSVTDQYGNSVPDGTVVNLGYLDSIIVSNFSPAINATADENASTIATNAELSDGTNTGINAASIIRNDTSRSVSQNDRVLIINAQANDKSRFVQSAGNFSITTYKNYNNDQSNLRYLVGSSMLGGQVSGLDVLDNIIKTGFATTRAGTATFYITYPADDKRILTGCYDDLTIDTRVQPPGSAQTWLVVESNDTGAATLDNRACFAAIAPYKLINLSGITGISASTSVNYSLEDANSIRLPFVELSALVSYTTNTGGLDVSVSNGGCRTISNGTCGIEINVSGGTSGDAASITISAPGQATSGEITVNIQ